jgi:hypothetical protein
MESILTALRALPARVRASDLAKVFFCDPQSIRKWARTGQLPKATKLGPRLSTWSRDEVITHLQAREEASHATAASA